MHGSFSWQGRSSAVVVSAAPHSPGRLWRAAATSTVLLSACAQMPVGPTVPVMPGAHKPFDVFVQDDALCRSWAAHSLGVPGNEAAADEMLKSAAAGALVGAVAGGVLGGNRGAGAGAVMGTVVGVSAGANQRAQQAHNAQQRYDIAYQQCMHARGNLVPGMPPPPAEPASGARAR